MRFVLPILLTLLASATANAQGLTINAQIHNAPGWQPSHSYTYSAGPPNGHFTRVVAGAGWTPSGGKSGTWNSGQALNAYQLIAPTVGSCQSAPSGTGPSGTGSSIPDGTCAWKYLSNVDYISLTGWALDNGKVWASGTSYGSRDVVNTGANSDVYQQQAGGCSSTVQPTGTAPEIPTSDGCIWDYVGTIYYSSRSHPFPHEKFWSDRFQGYIAPGKSSFNGSITNSILTVDQMNSGTIYVGMPISGTGIPAGISIYRQLSGTTGRVGTYSLGSASNLSETTITGTYGVLTITTPPANYPLAVTPMDPISNEAMGSNTGRAPNPNIGNVDYPIGGSGTTWVLKLPQTIGSAASPVTFYHTRLDQVIYMYNDLYHAQLWNDREYVGGQNGELNPLTVWNHNYAYNDSVPWDGEHCLMRGCTVGGRSFPFYIEPAPGEGFADTLNANPSTLLTGYNANIGVGLRGINVPGITVDDNVIFFRGLQISSNTQVAAYLANRSCNTCTIENNILQSGTAIAVVDQINATINCGFYCYWYNNLIISAGLVGVAADYGGRFYYNTFVCPSGTCGSAMSNTWDWINMDGMVINGNAVFGFQYFTSTNCYQQGWNSGCAGQPTVQGTNNATDLSPTNASNFPATQIGSSVEYGIPFYTGAGVTVNGRFYPFCASKSHDGSATIIPATCGIMGNVSPSAAFVSWPNNLRPNPSTPLIGAGAHFAAWNWCLTSVTGRPGSYLWGASSLNPPPGAGSWSGCMIDPSTPDLLNNSRPQGRGYDIGAVQSLSGTSPPPPTSLPGGRLLR